MLGMTYLKVAPLFGLPPQPSSISLILRVIQSVRLKNYPSMSRCCRIALFKVLNISRSLRHSPPFHPLRATNALPGSLFGPVDCSHGFQRFIASACCLRCSGVHVRAAIAHHL